MAVEVSGVLSMCDLIVGLTMQLDVIAQGHEDDGDQAMADVVRHLTQEAFDQHGVVRCVTEPLPRPGAPSQVDGDGG